MVKVASLLLALTACAFAADNAGQIREAAKQVAKNLEVQSKLPTDSGTADAAVRRERNGGGNFGGGGIYLPGGEVIFGLMQWALIMVAVIAILALIAILVREPLEARFKPGLSPALPLEREAAPPADPRELIARADRFASEGMFAEAMHCVLLAAMLLVGGGGEDADSRTSWELLRTASLPGPQVSALRDLVIRVERAWFGQRPAGADDYRHVRGIFDAFQRPAAENA